jgi:hypothetical protein
MPDPRQKITFGEMRASGVRGLLREELTEPCRSFCAPSVRASVCVCVVCNGFEEILHEAPGKEEWKPCPVCAAASARQYDTGVCQTCKGAGSLKENGQRID